MFIGYYYAAVKIIKEHNQTTHRSEIRDGPKAKL